MTSFHIRGVDPNPFRHLFGADEATLRAAHAVRYVVDSTPGFPDRAALRDLELGERALLVNYQHQTAATPYRASHAIYLREGADVAALYVDSVPPALRARVLSLRAFDTAGMMLDADLVDGAAAEPLIQRLFADPRVSEIHAHFAKRGCFAARIERA